MEKLPSEVVVVFVVVCIVCLAGLFILPLLCDVSIAEYMRYVPCPIRYTVLFLFAIGCYVDASDTANEAKTRKQVQIEREQRNQLEASVKNGVEDGYKIYANNDRVELSDVDLGKYSIKIDAEKKKIILSK